MDDMKKWRVRAMRRNISSYGWALLLYYTLLNVAVAIAVTVSVVIGLVPELLASGGMLEEETLLHTTEEAASNGWGYLVACALGVALIWAWKGKDFFRNLWKTGEPMKAKAFFPILCVFISGQLAFQVMATFQEVVLNQFGLSILEAMEQASAQTDSFSMFLYLSLGAPVVEEIVFRGAILRGLERYGKWFALLISSLLFGAFHGNLIQSPYAFLVGLVLGYVTLRYNIVWAMVLHMINNLLLGDTLPRLTGWMGETGSGMVFTGLILLCSLCALVTLIRKRRSVRAFVLQEPFNWEALEAFATAPGMIVLLVIMEISAVAMLFLL